LPNVQRKVAETTISDTENNHFHQWKQTFPDKETTVSILKLVETTFSKRLLGGNKHFPDNFFAKMKK